MAEALLAGAVMSAVNLSEVAAKLAEVGIAGSAIREAIEPLGVDVVPFGEPEALATALLRPESRSAGLSLGDRACIALGQARGLPVLTTDLAWTTVHLDPEVEIVMLR